MNGSSLLDLTPQRSVPASTLTIGLVNNMPPAACAATERQFGRLLEEAGSNQRVVLECYRTGIRGAAGAPGDVEGMFGTEVDALIVTGAEPQSASLRQEPIWPFITNLVDWTAERNLPAIWSCLAAHAAVLYLDGVDRVRRDRKISGLFKGEVVAADHRLMDGVRDGWTIPHSRYNDLPEERLRASGYRILVRSAEAGVDLFEKANDTAFLFLQSHPEYDADTLRREFHRDVKRFQAGERADPPVVPHGYFGSAAESPAMSAGELSCVSRENVDDILAWLGRPGEQPREAPWRPAAVALFRNWLWDVAARKARRDGAELRFSAQERHGHDLTRSGLVPC
jgi:homoserine O-succinyltransferase/O-acetyltransferase